MPENIGKYYSKGYYSYLKLKDLSPRIMERVKRRLLFPRMTRSKLGWNDRFGHILCKVSSGPLLPHWIEYLEGPVPLDLRILDVGCGAGEGLLSLRRCGFTNLLGVDPYIEAPLVYDCGLEIRKCQIDELSGRYDLITFNHVFEHLEDPRAVLQTAKELLSEGGRILIRIPLSDSKAYELYREDWVQLDAPRHITLQTRRSMDHIAKESGLKILRAVYDSTAFQFWGSEQYRKGIPLSDPRSYSTNPDAGVFSDAEIESFADEASRLNKLEQGDQSAFILAADS